MSNEQENEAVDTTAIEDDVIHLIDEDTSEIDANGAISEDETPIEEGATAFHTEASSSFTAETPTKLQIHKAFRIVTGITVVVLTITTIVAWLSL